MATENSDVIGEDSSADVHLVLNGKGGGDPLRHPARILSGRDGFNWEKRGMTSKAAYQGYQVQKDADRVATEQQFFGPTVINAGHSRIRETQAEAVVFVVCRGVGLKTNTAAADYIALHNGDKKTLAESLSVIQETAAKILNELLPEKDVTRPEQQRQPYANPQFTRRTSGADGGRKHALHRRLARVGSINITPGMPAVNSNGFAAGHKYTKYAKGWG